MKKLIEHNIYSTPAKDEIVSIAPPSTREIVDKVNEIVDWINSVEKAFSELDKKLGGE